MLIILTKEQKGKIGYLKQIKKLDKDIDRKIDEMETWKCRATKTTPTLSDMPHGTNANDNVSMCVAKMVDLSTEINNDIDRLVDLRREIIAKIDEIEDYRLANILKDRYISYWSWEEVAYKNNYSWQHVYRLHEKALALIKI